MDDELESLEAELKQLQPRRPSVRVEHAISAQLDAPPRRAGPARWFAFGSLPIAAAVAIAIALPREQETTDPQPRAMAAEQPGQAPTDEDIFKPVSAENVLYSAEQEEGLVTLQDGTPARRERLQYVDTIRWQNPRTRASLTMTVPREEVRVVPVSFQ